jgi:hypothetical protein
VTIASFLKNHRPIPARTARLAAFPEAFRLCRLTEAPTDELLQIFGGEEVEITPIAARRRRPRRRRHKKKGHRPPQI